MPSSIRLADAGLPDTPPPGSARIYIEEYSGRLHLKMIRPDGTIEVFGTLNLPLGVENGGTGSSDEPNIGQILIGDGSRYKPGSIVGGNKINVVSSEDYIEINAEVQDFSVSLSTPSEFFVTREDFLGATSLYINKNAQNANKIYAGPELGEDLEPNFRFLVENDIPSLNSSKITDFSEKVCETIPLGLLESTNISFSYDESLEKTSFSLKDSGVVPGIYGSITDIPVIAIDSTGLITHATTINIKESVEDYVGQLITSSISINSEYDDLNDKLYLHVNEETLITTNISDNENVRAPTSQSIKQYVDDNVSAERVTRSTAVSDLYNSIDELREEIGTDLQQRLGQLEQELLDESIFSRYDNFVISVEDIERGYLVLNAKNVLLASVVAFAGRVPLLQDIDFVISKDLQDNVIFTFIGGILPDGDMPLEVEENIRINYLHRR